MEQSIRRGLRLPYGRRTGDPGADRLTIVAHDRFQEIIDKARTQPRRERAARVRVPRTGRATSIEAGRSARAAARDLGRESRRCALAVNYDDMSRA
jgi:type III restriction enzyme